MSILINGIALDHYEGNLPLPEITTDVYTSPLTPHVGAQNMPPVSQAAQLTLKRFDTQAAHHYNRDLQLSTKGQIVLINLDGVQYDQLPYQVKFYVADVEVITHDIIPAWSGYRLGSAINLSPASRLITRWTIHSIPAWS